MAIKFPVENTSLSPHTHKILTLLTQPSLHQHIPLDSRRQTRQASNNDRRTTTISCTRESAARRKNTTPNARTFFGFDTLINLARPGTAEHLLSTAHTLQDHIKSLLALDHHDSGSLEIDWKPYSDPVRVAGADCIHYRVARPGWQHHVPHIHHCVRPTAPFSHIQTNSRRQQHTTTLKKHSQYPPLHHPSRLQHPQRLSRNHAPFWARPPTKPHGTTFCAQASQAGLPVVSPNPPSPPSIESRSSFKPRTPSFKSTRASG